METIQGLKEENRELRLLLGALWLEFATCIDDGQNCETCRSEYLCYVLTKMGIKEVKAWYEKSITL